MDLVGKKFAGGNIEVLEEDKDYSVRNGIKSKAKYWKCKCNLCGKIFSTRTWCLTSGHTKSCGCYISTSCSERHTKHNGYGTRLYTIWNGMKKRCYNSNDKDFKNYGGRGITVCDEWKDNFVKFREWATSSGYNDSLTIDRINVDSDYCPENCRWVGMGVQNNNRRSNHFITVNNSTKTIADWSRITGVSSQTILSRLNKGVQPAVALELVKDCKKETSKKVYIYTITGEYISFYNSQKAALKSIGCSYSTLKKHINNLTPIKNKIYSNNVLTKKEKEKLKIMFGGD